MNDIRVKRKTKHEGKLVENIATRYRPHLPLKYNRKFKNYIPPYLSPNYFPDLHTLFPTPTA